MFSKIPLAPNLLGYRPYIDNTVYPDYLTRANRPPVRGALGD